MPVNNASTDTAKKAAIYREAARLVEEVNYRFYGCCLDDAGQPQPGGGVGESPMQRAFERRFNLRRLEDFSERGGTQDDTILALCFMAAMVEAGDA